MSSPTLSRRALLRGAGAAVALPLLEAMTRGDAFAQAAPTRVVAFYFVHGAWPEAWTPAREGPAWPMTPCLEPLAGLRDDVTVVSGLDNDVALELQTAGGPHSLALGSLVTGVPVRAPGTVGGPSWDRVAARSLGADSRFRSLALVAEGAPRVSEGTSSSLLGNFSWDGPHRPVPPTRDPRALFDRFFGGDGGAAAQRRRSVLDHTRESLLRLQRGLGAADRRRVDEHLTSLRELERELFTPAPACAQPPAPAPGALPPPERARQLIALLALALRCDLTRVASFALGNGISEHVLSEAGSTERHHDQSHRPDEALFVRITRYQIGHLAALLRALADAREGEGRLLDRCVVLATSEVSEGWSHSPRDMPALLAGRGGGLRPGAHLRFQGDAFARLQLTALHAAGVRVDRFGVRGASALPGLL